MFFYYISSFDFKLNLIRKDKKMSEDINVIMKTLNILNENITNIFNLIKIELVNHKINNFTNSEIILINSINEDAIKIGDLKKFGHFYGTNPTYIVNKLVKNGYLKKNTGKDKRVIMINITKKGKETQNILNEILTNINVTYKLSGFYRTLQQVEEEMGYVISV
jgi:DNA-binding MarR family transcriptional regulator